MFDYSWKTKAGVISAKLVNDNAEAGSSLDVWLNRSSNVVCLSYTCILN